eukprot:CAMPEP_0116897846 /NCGR_PEP_ID=MMETSP0467-20121206/6712_1 /TAXON_ID=283647 /ORGANISM="Mesodinium pulex, Strain SPMC105" /LENGTH=53 /DNA_ID=CAMNT_0004569669 /DNA_START=85 /DNA_END=246 /DNA_ORIENTATION=+
MTETEIYINLNENLDSLDVNSIAECIGEITNRDRVQKDLLNTKMLFFVDQMVD